MTTTAAERILDDLHSAQEIAAQVADGLDDLRPGDFPTREQLRARQLVSRLHALESQLLECPPND